jgi:hypothetical protein
MIHEGITDAQLALIEQLVANEWFRFAPAPIRYEVELDEHIAHITAVVNDGTRIPVSFNLPNAAARGRPAVRERFSLIKINGKIWSLIEFLQRMLVVARAPASMQKFMGKMPI